MKWFIFLLLFSCGSIQQEEQTEYIISSDVYHTYRIPFQSFPDSLRMVLPQDAVQGFYREWSPDHPEVQTPPETFSIPVVSPSEMKRLTELMSKEEIEKFAKESFIQNSRFNVVCIGQEESGKDLDYFMVLESEELTKIRLELLEVYRRRGGERKNFFATAYTPIIPLNKSPTAYELVTEKGVEDCIETVRSSKPFDGKGPTIETDPVI